MADHHNLPDFLVLNSTVQHYNWGGEEFIPSLLGIDNEEKRPYAELWMGAHPKSPSVTEINGQEFPLDKLFEIHASELMGKKAAEKFDNRLPFLLKVLDVNKMLSIQVHPTIAQAEIGFARENSLGIPLSAPHRNYKDDNHKPEVHVALTDFWMLHGFRPLLEIAEILEETPEFKNVMPEFPARIERIAGNELQQQQLLKDLYTKIMTMPQTNVDSILAPLIERITPQYLNGKLTKGTPDFWAARAATQFFPREGRYDRGIFSIYLLNLVHLRQGEGTFQDAGMLHAYLEGQNVELMANSDNVLRGGLTSKHIDIPELLQTVTFTGAKPEILSGDSHAYNERIFRTPAKDFQLSRIDLYPRNSFESKPGHGLDVFFVLLGSASLQAPGKAAMFSKGKAFLVPAAFEYSIQAKENTVLFRATLPA